LAAAHSKALDKLETALARRAEALAEHDRRIAEAGTDVRQAIASMAVEVGPELTAHVLGLDPIVVRRLARNSSADSSPPKPAPGANGRRHA
jgi:hypothetical protein